MESRDTATWTVKNLSTNRVIYCIIANTEAKISPFCLLLVMSAVLLPSVLVVFMVLLHQDSDQQHGDHHHLFGSFLLPPPWVQNTQQVVTSHIFSTSHFSSESNL